MQQEGSWKLWVFGPLAVASLGFLIWWFAKGNSNPSVPTATIEPGETPVYRASEEPLDSEGSLLPTDNSH